MAIDLGIAKHWYHPGKFPHYDIPKKRIEEITKRCTLVSSKKIVKLIKENL
jgi:hypothetical protein